MPRGRGNGRGRPRESADGAIRRQRKGSFTDEEWREVTEAAKARGKSAAAFVREAAISAARRVRR